MKFCKMFEWAEDYEVIRKKKVTTLTQGEPKTSESLLSDNKHAQGAGIRGNSPAWLTPLMGQSEG
jgi:hypothetical protein